jgi:hypothetical protein
MKNLCLRSIPWLTILFALSSCKMMQPVPTGRVSWTVQADILPRTSWEQFFLPLDLQAAQPRYYVSGNTLIAVSLTTDNAIMAAHFRDVLLATGLTKSIKTVTGHE